MVQFSEMESGSEVSMEFIQTQQTKPQLTPKIPPMMFPVMVCLLDTPPSA